MHLQVRTPGAVMLHLADGLQPPFFWEHTGELLYAWFDFNDGLFTVRSPFDTSWSSYSPARRPRNLHCTHRTSEEHEGKDQHDGRKLLKLKRQRVKVLLCSVRRERSLRWHGNPHFLPDRDLFLEEKHRNPAALEHTTQIYADWWLRQSTFTLPHSTFTLPHSTFTLPHITLSLPHITLSLPHSTFSVPHSTFSVPDSIFSLPWSTFALPHSSLARFLH